MRRLDGKTEIRYIPSKWDETQLTEIVITPSVAKATQTIYMRLRDKYQFKVGTGLSMDYLRFEMLDTYIYYDKANKEFWDDLAKDATKIDCTVTSGVVTKCAGKSTFNTPRPP